MQIIGKVNPDLSIKVLTSLDLGTGVGASQAFLSPPQGGSPSGQTYLGGMSTTV